jgi:hypothetical protein
LSNNAIRLTIDHEPIKGVTAKMVQWAWRNPHLMVKAPGTDKEYPM